MSKQRLLLLLCYDLKKRQSHCLKICLIFLLKLLLNFLK
nr:MAG TPA: hypothetical protein [Caudoviricetes sp.]